MRACLLLLLALPAVAAELLNWDSDAEVLAYLERAGSRLVQNGATTPKRTLLSQLRRAQCRLELTAAPALVREPAELYSRARGSVLIVAGVYRCRRCADWHVTVASGFVVARNGVAVTNCHVFQSEEPEGFVAMTRNGEVLAVREVLAASEADDLAVIQLELPPTITLEPLPLARGKEAAPVGARISVISHADSHFYLLTEGVISRYLDWAVGSRVVPRVGITADFAVGSSGAPVLNARGEVVAVVCATHTVFADKTHGKRLPQMTLKLCVPVDRLRALCASATAR